MAVLLKFLLILGIIIYIFSTIFFFLEYIYDSYAYKKLIKKNYPEMWDYYKTNKKLYNIDYFKTAIDFIEMLVLGLIPIVNTILLLFMMANRSEIVDSVFKREKNHMESETKRIKKSLGEVV